MAYPNGSQAPMTASHATDSRFDSLPEDEGVAYQKQVKVGALTALHEFWNWDGYWVENLVFCNEDSARFDDTELEAFVRAHIPVKENTCATVKRSESGYTFVNFDHFTLNDD
jgi:hypothetical protein